jgi:hypothetical protein
VRVIRLKVARLRDPDLLHQRRRRSQVAALIEAVLLTVNYFLNDLHLQLLLVLALSIDIVFPFLNQILLRIILSHSSHIGVGSAAHHCFVIARRLPRGSFRLVDCLMLDF